MNKKTKKWIGAIATALLLAVILTTVIVQLVIHSSGSQRYFSGEAQVYYQSLLDVGFPEDYAVPLTELHLLHPAWSFTPLMITEADADYTWDYVIKQETAKKDLNVIYTSNTYKAYHHPFNREVYDSGYYQASTEAVEYFMDPRNFLNEADIFQFYSLAGGNTATLAAVEAILQGTFMENVTLENGKTYAAYFLEVGRELDINPIFLAAKVRQEQGVGGASPLISGECGDRLRDYYVNHTQENEDGDSVLTPSDGYTEADLLALNGYYNYYNINATGKGLFSIYYKAMQYAKRGTADMVDSWGDASWNTRWKSIYGGAYFLKKEYIDCYQSTVYLQKFNVDSRAGKDENFSSQYMTAVFGAMGEGRTLYQSFSALDALDASANFLIPVYGNMPTKPCADPAKGDCKNFAQHTTRYEYEVELTSPARISAENGAAYLDAQTYSDGSIKLGGAVSHTNTIDGLEYAWDGGEWQEASSGKTLNLSLDAHFPENSSHILVIRGRASYNASGSGQELFQYFLYAVIYVEIITPPSVDLSFHIGNTVTDKTVHVGTSVALPICQDEGFAGWLGTDGTFLPSGAETVAEESVAYTAIFFDFRVFEGAAISKNPDLTRLRFSAALKREDYTRLMAVSPDLVSFSATLSANGRVKEQSVSKTLLTAQSGTEWIRLDAETAPLSEQALSTPYKAAFCLTLHYTNGEQKSMTPTGIPDIRSAKQVAQMALADNRASLTPATIAHYEAVAAAP